MSVGMEHCFKLLFVASMALFLANGSQAQGLKVGFYSKTCPNVETIVRNTTASFLSRAPTLAAPLLRMHFHDCFVRGCDGSVLLNSTQNSQAEKAAIPNLSIRGFQVIDAAKDAIEKVCPGVVSCADILALVARDSVYLIKGPFWQVPTGRRDGRVSLLSDALANLPPPFFNITQLKALWQQKGLNVKDLAVLSGGHTIGNAHCPAFSNRLYNFTGKGDTDTSMDPNYIAQLQQKCKPGDTTTIVELDPGSFRTFDTSYYNYIAKRRGLLQSDAALLNDKETKAYLDNQLTSSSPSFFKDFGVSMVKMGNIGVLTGKAGEIRKHCALVN
ncbi:peroxidase 27-like [Aristolochia californica]|uniref:peroxidase 27-like n=1 Tax=Aristolochia californica TaxID=171875 RepID=UPI0035D593AB